MPEDERDCATICQFYYGSRQITTPSGTFAPILLAPFFDIAFSLLVGERAINDGRNSVESTLTLYWRGTETVQPIRVNIRNRLILNLLVAK